MQIIAVIVDPFLSIFHSIYCGLLWKNEISESLRYKNQGVACTHKPTVSKGGHGQWAIEFTSRRSRLFFIDRIFLVMPDGFGEIRKWRNSVEAYWLDVK